VAESEVNGNGSWKWTRFTGARRCQEKSGRNGWLWAGNGERVMAWCGCVIGAGLVEDSGLVYRKGGVGGYGGRLGVDCMLRNGAFAEAASGRERADGWECAVGLGVG
jgi:hypothetical protein